MAWSSILDHTAGKIKSFYSSAKGLAPLQKTLYGAAAGAGYGAATSDRGNRISSTLKGAAGGAVAGEVFAAGTFRGLGVAAKNGLGAPGFRGYGATIKKAWRGGYR